MPVVSSKVCTMCGVTYAPASNRQLVCNGCKPEHDRLWRAKQHKRTYVRKGYDNKCEKHNSYKSGIGFFREKALTHLPNKCATCGSTANLCVHHKDENRKHNELDNLMILCKACHQAHHTTRDATTGRYTPKQVKA